jgi:glycosyltransferase involved in cell wall biosynthesis
MANPLVSCIMPTANRQQFIPYAIDYFLHQDYENTELIILDTGKQPCSGLIPQNPKIRYEYRNTLIALGEKRNLCCKQAKGNIIVHWDDDDWYAEDWISRQVKALVSHPGINITGLRHLNFFSSVSGKRWEYIDAEDESPWLYGATFAYWRSFWELHPFRNMNSGEDIYFISNHDAIVYPHDYTDGYLGIIHPNTKSIRLYENPKEKLQQEKWFATIDAPQQGLLKEKIFNDQNAPLVSCIMPTANRQRFIASAIYNFLDQDYPNKELIIIDDGQESVADLIPSNSQIKYYFSEPLGSIGTKRNIACSKARGEFILHWDDDDWRANDWISYELKALIDSGSDICGINQVQYFSPDQNQYWMTFNYNSKKPWIIGASLIYRKSFWCKHPFKDLPVEEDNDFIRNNGAKIFAHDYYQGFIATSHGGNTSIKFSNYTKQKN